VIITPFGKYRYNRLPMGIKQSPDIVQEIMEDLLKDLKAIECYIDDVGVFNSFWNQHLKTLEIVLQRLQDNGFKINPLKCEWAVKETDWLGYWLTPRGLQPWKKKINAILKMSRPTTISEVRSVIGAVSYYRDMFPQRSHILTPLTAVSGSKGPLKWTEEMQKAFDTMKPHRQRCHAPVP
jgi:Reverse transcriptase (RNA-dependent DNA polymerase)